MTQEVRQEIGDVCSQASEIEAAQEPEKVREFLKTDKFNRDYEFWKSDKATLTRIEVLINSIRSSPFKGIGHPEPLKGRDGNIWSRRINKKDRIIYAVTSDKIIFMQCRKHYEDK